MTKSQNTFIKTFSGLNGLHESRYNQRIVGVFDKGMYKQSETLTLRGISQLVKTIRNIRYGPGYKTREIDHMSDHQEQSLGASVQELLGKFSSHIDQGFIVVDYGNLRVFIFGMWEWYCRGF